MTRLLFYLVFVLSVALTSGGIIIASRIRKTNASEVFSTLLYFQVFIYTFGFYGIWGQVAVKVYLSTFLSAPILKPLSDMALLLGLPFLIIAWMMLIKFAAGISGRGNNRWFIPVFMVSNFAILLTLGYYITKKETLNSSLLIRYYYIIMNIIYYFTASYIIHFKWKRRSLIHDFDRRLIAPVLFLIMIIQCIPLIFYTSQSWLAIAFILSFFLGNTFLPLYLNYGTLLTLASPENDNNITLEEFCRKYDVSAREMEVIREICNGLSNKEISEKLFISLQTVKDHTHRIYIKTNIKNRVQLINILKSYRS